MKQPILAFLLAGLLALAACHPAPRSEAPGLPGQALVDQAAALVRRVRAETNARSLDLLFAEAKGVCIVPALYRAGYLGGLDLGQGLLLARDHAGFYSEPVFLSLGGVSFGLQVGIQRTSAILFLMSPEALDAATRGALSLGTGASISVLTWGEAHALDMYSPLPDVYAFLDPEGFYAGVSLSGAGLRLNPELLQARYGQGATAQDVLFERRFYATPGAEGLQRALSPFWLDAL